MLARITMVGTWEETPWHGFLNVQTYAVWDESGRQPLLLKLNQSGPQTIIFLDGLVVRGGGIQT